MDDEQERLGRPDGYRYAAPEPEDEQQSRGWVYGLLALVVVGLLVLVVTGEVPMYPGG